jgi:DNA (cytosine-5)-methyltransferase 1
MAPSSAARAPEMRVLLEDDEIIVDHFAGGGGASSGVEWAAGRSPDIAINHDAEAIAMHKANHPDTRHYIEDVWAVDPKVACGGRRVGLMWLSPTCTHFSKAKGSALDEDSVKIRGLAWVAVRWAAAVKPRIICLENVEEFEKWGPLHRQHTDGCTGEERERRIKGVSRVSQGCRAGCNIHKPIKSRVGETFRAWVDKLRRYGYRVEWRLLRAHEYGAPTKRRRLFLVARCDGQKIVWPETTHGENKLKPRSAAECIDWSNLPPSIFDRDRPLAEKTLARIARGIQKFVLDNPRPFIVPVAYGGTDGRAYDSNEPMPTICGNRGGHAIAVPYLVHRSNGERPVKVDADGTVHAAQAPRIYDATEPLGTIMGQGIKHAACVAMLIKNNGGKNDACGASGQYIDEAIDTISTRDSKSVAVAHLVKLRGTSDSHVASSSQSVEEAAPTISAQGTHIGAVAAFLVKYNRTGGPESVEQPTSTLSTRDRLGLVTVTLNGEEYILVDIGMRMLEPRELFRCQGFDENYIIDPVFKGKPLTKTAQIRMCGNSVPPQMAEVIARAQLEAA